jgi:hypothetical protein
MNERIKLLAEQARTYARDYVADCKHYGYYMEHNELEVKFEEKFAELIVRECVRKVRNRGGMCGALASNWIEEHFYGVEE